MAWRRIGDKQLPKPMLTWFTDAYMRQFAGEKVSWDFQVRILHSAEEDNLYPLDSNIASLCQSIEINNNKDAYMRH